MGLPHEKLPDGSVIVRRHPLSLVGLHIVDDQVYLARPALPVRFLAWMMTAALLVPPYIYAGMWALYAITYTPVPGQAAPVEIFVRTALGLGWLAAALLSIYFLRRLRLQAAQAQARIVFDDARAVVPRPYRQPGTQPAPGPATLWTLRLVSVIAIVPATLYICMWLYMVALYGLPYDGPSYLFLGTCLSGCLP